MFDYQAVADRLAAGQSCPPGSHTCPYMPKQVEKMFVYLDDLRISGVTNMYGAGAYLEQVFDLERKVAGKILGAWMKTFGERNPA